MSIRNIHVALQQTAHNILIIRQNGEFYDFSWNRHKSTLDERILFMTQKKTL